MKKSLLFSMMCMFLCLTSILHAQNPNPDWESVEIPEVIFTECYIGNTDAMYCEITNTEDTAVDLSSFDLIGGPHRYLEYFPDERWFVKIQWNGIIKLDGIILQPGESKVFAKVFDKAVNADNPNTPKTNLNMLPYIDHVIFEEDSDDPDVPFIDQPEILAFDFDSITSDELERGFLGTAGGRQAWGLLYHYEHLDSLGLMTQDSIMADIFNLWQQDGTDLEGTVSNIAGVESATVNSIIVRKYGSKSSTNWDISRGVASEDSYWMVVPKPSGNLVYTSVGIHGDYQISVKAKANTVAEVNDDAKTITVPWEAVRGDSVIVNNLEFGEGMAWQFFKDSIDSEDSAYVRVRDGDLLQLYAFGTELRTETYTFKTLDATPDLAIARSKVPHYNGAWRNTGYFTVTTRVPGMDSILNIGNQLRIDTLLTYIEIPPKASREIIFVDGDTNRVDLKDGDILRVTSENQEVVKDYYLQVNDYNLSDNTSLSAIMWPDYDKDNFFEWEFLRQDTLPEFSPGKFNYTLVLPDDYVNVPALFATTADLNAQLDVDRAVNLTGTLEERTTTFTVRSESDTLETVYSVVFELDLGAALQLTDLDPFISEQLGFRHNNDFHIELFNPNNGADALDFSRYMLVRASKSSNPADVISTYEPLTPSDVGNQDFYVPGYKFNYTRGESETPSDWTWKNTLVGGLTADANVDPFVASGDVFVVSNWNEGSATESNMYGTPTAEVSNVNMQGNPDFTNLDKRQGVTDFEKASSLYLYEILNDSIIQGTKGIWESDEDYRLVDAISLLDITMISGLTSNGRQCLVRKPNIQRGNTIVGKGGSIDEDADTCEFVFWGRHDFVPIEHRLTGATMGQFLGWHEMDPVVSHLSTVTSNAYKVDLGYEGDLSIKGDMTSTTVAQFMANLNKPDTAQSLKVERSEVILADDETVATGDVLVVISGDSVNTTTYTLEAAPLSNDVTLTAVDDLGIMVDSENLTVSGFSYEEAIVDVLAGVECHELSVINVIDANDDLVPLLTQSRDTSLLEPMQETKVFNGLYFEVVAEDGTIAKYELIAEASSSEAYLTSNVFTVSQEENNKNVSGVSGGYSVSTFLNLLTPSGKATLELRDKTGVERTYGALQIDDYVAVVSEDGMYTAKYAINFYSEEEPDVISSIKHQNINSLIKLYPNPTSSLLNIENVKVGSVVQVISLNGSMVYTNVVNDDRCTIDMSRMNSGVYIVRMVEKEGASVFRVLKN